MASVDILFGLVGVAASVSEWGLRPLAHARGYENRSRGSLFSQNLAQGGDHEVHVANRRTVTHQTDAPRFAGHRSKTAANFDAVVFEQPFAHAGIIGARWDRDAVEGVQRTRGDVAQPKFFQSGAQAL